MPLGSGDTRNSDRDLSYENFVNFSKDESYPRSTTLVFVVANHLNRHEVSEGDQETFA